KVISPATLGKITLCGLVALIWGLGLFVLFDLQRYMRDIRRRQGDLEETFSPEDQRLARGEPPTETTDAPAETTNTRDLNKWLVSQLRGIEPFLFVLCSVVTIAGMLAGYAIWQL